MNPIDTNSLHVNICLHTLEIIFKRPFVFELYNKLSSKLLLNISIYVLSNDGNFAVNITNNQFQTFHKQNNRKQMLHANQLRPLLKILFNIWRDTFSPCVDTNT